MTTNENPQQQGTTPNNEGEYTKFIVDSLAKGTQPVYISAKAGQFAPLIEILLDDYDPDALDEFQFALDALKIKHKAFRIVLEAPDQAPKIHVATDESMPPLPDFATLPYIPLEKVSPFLGEYVTYSCQISPEGADDFHLACGLWALSTVAARRIYVNLAKPAYTPLAIALVSRSSLFAKSHTASAAIQLLRAAGLHWMLGDDETTPQKMLSDMSGHVPPNYGDLDLEHQQRVEQRISMSGQIGWYYDEFNQLIDAMSRPGPMQDFAGLLRKLDNCQDEYRYSTKGGGQEIILNPYLALLASTTPANLSKHAGKGNAFWNDGFWARFVFITPPANSFKTSTMKRGRITVPFKLAQKLKDWNDRLGVPNCRIEQIIDEKDRPTGRYRVERDPLTDVEIEMDDQAYQAYDHYRIALRSIVANNKNQDLDSSYVRTSDRALRIAALISSLEGYKTLDINCWTVAQQITEHHRKNLHELYAQINTQQAEDSAEDTLIEYMKKNTGKPLTAREILQYGPSELRKQKSTGLEILLTTLQKSGIVEQSKEGRKELWSMRTVG